ncbi:MAG: hypothetical protein D6770_04285 [Anaerolineae bacterium]|nr:MAG: hypothetical protein D6770_04285 [Anaerolineae bacterium]
MADKKASHWFLLALSLAGTLLVAIATWRYGAGVSADAVKYLATAAHLLAGDGFIDHTGHPLIWWPPLYPLILAALSKLTAADVFLVAWYLNLLLMPVNTFLAGLLLERAFGENSVYAWLGTAFVAFSESAVRLHANVNSDVLYVTFSLLFLLIASHYMREKSSKALTAMTVLAALAMLLRWQGAGLLAMGGVVILAARWREWRALLRDGLWMALSLLPVAAWVYFHNILRYNTFWGTNETLFDPWLNLELSLAKMLHWFLPYHPRLRPLFEHPVVLVVGIGAVLALLARRPDWSRWWRALWRPEVFPVAFFLPLSLLGIIFTMATGDHLDLFTDRYYVGFLAPVMVWLFITLDALILPRLKWREATVRNVLIGAFVLWLAVYPGVSMAEYLSTSLREGEASHYNYYNNHTFRENPALPVIQRLLQEKPEATVYSNYADAVWFLLRRDSPLMPRSATMDVEELRVHYAGWPGEEGGYIFWFLPNEYKHVVPPNVLAEIADVELLFRSEEGEVYAVRAADGR